MPPDIFKPYVNSAQEYGPGTIIQFWDASGHERAKIVSVEIKQYGTRYTVEYDNGKTIANLDIHAYDHRVIPA